MLRSSTSLCKCKSTSRHNTSFFGLNTAYFSQYMKYTVLAWEEYRGQGEEVNDGLHGEEHEDLVLGRQEPHEEVYHEEHRQGEVDLKKNKFQFQCYLRGYLRLLRRSKRLPELHLRWSVFYLPAMWWIPSSWCSAPCRGSGRCLKGENRDRNYNFCIAGCCKDSTFRATKTLFLSSIFHHAGVAIWPRKAPVTRGLSKQPPTAFAGRTKTL